VVQLIRHLRWPEASGVAIEQIALHGSAESGGAAGAVGFPAGGKYQRASQRNVRGGGRLLRRALLEGDHVVMAGREAYPTRLNPAGLAVN
jgi:hypothetical protein